jgi:hypothetical protein
MGSVRPRPLRCERQSAVLFCTGRREASVFSRVLLDGVNFIMLPSCWAMRCHRNPKMHVAFGGRGERGHDFTGCMQGTSGLPYSPLASF